MAKLRSVGGMSTSGLIIEVGGDDPDIVTQQELDEALSKLAPVNTVDKIPVENSENLITSGGVWGETHYRMSPGEEVKTLAEASVGEDMSGATLDFTSAVAGTLANTPEITFANGSRLGLSTDNQTWALWALDGRYEVNHAF